MSCRQRFAVCIVVLQLIPGHEAYCVLHEPSASTYRIWAMLETPV